MPSPTQPYTSDDLKASFKEYPGCYAAYTDYLSSPPTVLRGEPKAVGGHGATGVQRRHQAGQPLAGRKGKAAREVVLKIGVQRGHPPGRRLRRVPAQALRGGAGAASVGSERHLGAEGDNRRRLPARQRLTRNFASFALLVN